MISQSKFDYGYLKFGYFNGASGYSVGYFGPPPSFWYNSVWFGILWKLIVASLLIWGTSCGG